MKILPTVSTVVKGLRSEQAPKLLENIAKQINTPLNAQKMKTGIFEGWLVGLDDAGRFIATRGSKLPNGNFGTQSAYGFVEQGTYSQFVSELGGKTERGFFTELVNNLGLKFNMDRTKTGFVEGKPFAIEYDTGRFITAMKEKVRNGWGVQGQVGRVEGFNASKEVPKEALLSFKINKK